MVNHPNNIDEFFKQSLTNAELVNGSTTWGALKMKLISRSFLKFNPYTLNIYYVLPAFAAIMISYNVYKNYKPIDLNENFSEEFILNEPSVLNSENTISVLSTSKNSVSKNVYSNEHVMVEREELIEISMETIELTDFSNPKDSYISEIQRISTVSSQIENDYESDSTKEEVVVKKKYKKKSRPLKMH